VLRRLRVSVYFRLSFLVVASVLDHDILFHLVKDSSIDPLLDFGSTPRDGRKFLAARTGSPLFSPRILRFSPSVDEKDAKKVINDSSRSVEQTTFGTAQKRLNRIDDSVEFSRKRQSLECLSMHHDVHNYGTTSSYMGANKVVMFPRHEDGNQEERLLLTPLVSNNVSYPWNSHPALVSGSRPQDGYYVSLRGKRLETPLSPLTPRVFMSPSNS
jgi:hypothetical protein